jgi:hypothetical protein
MIELLMPLFDVTVGFDRQVLGPASWKFYWWALGRWALVVAAVCWVLGVIALVLGLGPEVYWVLMILGLVVVAEAFLFPYWQGRRSQTPSTTATSTSSRTSKGSE